MFQKASKIKTPPSILLMGGSGSGKTVGSLQAAVWAVKDITKVWFIDTEETAHKYQPTFGDFNVANIGAPYTYEKYMKAIEYVANNAKDNEILVVDSISHLWDGVGGLLDLQVELSASPKYSKNNIATWREIKPKATGVLRALTSLKIPVIVTCRTKDKMIRSEDNRNWLKVPDEPIFNQGIEFEFDVVFLLDSDHHVTCTKDRTSKFDGMKHRLMEESDIITILEWSSKGRDESEMLREFILNHIKNNPSPEDESKLKRLDNLNLVQLRAAVERLKDGK